MSRTACWSLSLLRCGATGVSIEVSTVDAATAASQLVNVGARLAEMARRHPDAMAVAAPRGRDRDGRRQYREITFRQLDEDSNRIAAGLLAMGAPRGARLVLMVPPGIDFFSLVFALCKAGLVAVLIDPGMGRRNLVKCLAEARPDGFVAIPLAQAVRVVIRRKFPNARYNATVGRRWFWGGPTLAELRQYDAADFRTCETNADDPAAIIFTTGSTGPPKGVLYRHANFLHQADEIRDFYGIRPGEIDVAAFPLFALFDALMGVGAVIPDMNPTRPADVDPENILEAVRDFNAVQAFGSPALWNTVGRYCVRHNRTLPTLCRVLTAGAPAPPHVLKKIKSVIHPQGDLHTPYGATEALPVASIAASEVLGETAARSATGAGTCVGSRFGGIQWKVIRITDEPIETIGQVEELPVGDVGELIVKGAVVTREYVTRTEANALHKIRDGAAVWHRMGDVGYLDERDRFWFCGRKAHRVRTQQGPMFTIPCESILNTHEHVYRSALVGVGEPDHQTAVAVVETWPEFRPASRRQQAELIEQLRALADRHELTRNIRHILLHPALPVDIRHNAKIFREKLAVWAAKKVGRSAAGR